MKDDLFKLIKTLSRSEKRYFKVFVHNYTMDKKNNYLRLFEAIEGQGHYDEQKIKAQFRGEKFIRHLPFEKNYLYRQILGAMLVYHLNHSAESLIYKALLQIKILYEKGQLESCRQLIARIRKIAVRYEKYTLLLEIHHWESRLQLVHLDFNEEIAKQLADEELQIVHDLSQVAEYRALYYKIFARTQKQEALRSSEKEEDLKKILTSPLLAANEESLSYASKFFYMLIYARYYQLTGDWEQCYLFQQKVVGIQETHEELLIEDPTRYIASLNNLINLCYLLKKFDGLRTTQLKLKSFLARHAKRLSKELQLRIFATATNHELLWYIRTGKFQEGLSLIPEVEDGLKRFGDKMNSSSLLTMYSNVSQLYFGAGDYSNARLWNLQILNHTAPDVREDVQALAKILNLIIHYELGNHDILESLTRSAYRAILKKKRLFLFETVMLNFIHKGLSPVSEPKELIKRFRELKAELETHGKYPGEQLIFENFDFISWLDSKITGRTMGEIVKEKRSITL